MSKADEMFERLGYCKTTSDCYKYHDEETMRDVFIKFGHRNVIKVIYSDSVYHDWKPDGSPGYIGVNELKAVNEKFKELEWL